MIRLDVRGTIQPIVDQLNRQAREQVPFATALALTRTAQFVQRKMGEEIDRVFDRPKDYTRGATFVRPATKANLSAEVLIKDQAFKSAPPIKWLAAEIYGGQRRHKAFELLLVRAGVMPGGMYAVPTRLAPLDANGNLSASEINRMLSDLRSRRDPYQNATAASKGRRLRSRTKAAYFYFSTYPANSRTRHLAPGIYRRTAATKMAGPVRVGIRPILLFTRQARYRVRLRFHEIAEQVAQLRFPIEFGLAMRRAIETAR
jgi:hypothetical protein